MFISINNLTKPNSSYVFLYLLRFIKQRDVLVEIITLKRDNLNSFMIFKMLIYTNGRRNT